MGDRDVDRWGNFPVTERFPVSTSRRLLAPHGRMVFVSFKMKQILQMLWTSVIGDKRVICAVMTERQEDLEGIRALVEAGKLRSSR